MSKAIDNNTENNVSVMSMAADYPVSPAQKNIYVIEQMTDVGNAYHVTLPLYITGKLNKERLGLALDKLTERHISLRTSFVMVNNELRQNISADIRLKKTLKTVDEKAIESEINDFRQKFILHEAPLLRAILLEIDNNRHVLVLDAHNIAIDDISLVLIAKELFYFYAHRELPLLPIIFPEQISNLEKQEQFWLEQLSGELPVLNMATDFPRPANKKYQGERVIANVTKKVADNLKTVAKENGISFFAVLLAAFTTLLSRYTGQDDIVVGSPFANRISKDMENMLGMFVNNLPLRTYPKRDKIFAEYMQDVNALLLGATENQSYPFEKLAEKLGIAPDASRNAVYDIMFAFTTEEDLFAPEGLSIKKYDYSVKTARFDLFFKIVENKQGLLLQFDYDCHLYRNNTVQRFAEHYVNLLDTITCNVKLPLEKLEFISISERKKLLHEFNDNRLQVPFNCSYHSLFKEQAKRKPHNIALVFKNEVLSYQELDTKTDVLASYLRMRGVKRESIVPVMLERSAEMVIAAIAIMKAGGAYLPLDIKYPEARLDYMLSDSNATLILSQPSLQEKFSQFSGEFIDVTAKELYKITAEGVFCSDINCGSDLAAILYTSGSTGMPKGTMILHRNIINMCYSENYNNAMTEADVVASYASFSFDGSMWSNFPALLAGAAVHIVPEEILLSLFDLNEYFEKNGITLTLLTTQLCEQFAELVDNKSLRIMATGGEKYKKYRPTNYKIANCYGPTEYTVLITRFMIDRHYDNIPIGKPVANAKVYVVDKDCKIQPLGVPGELCVAGPQLARGYRNREDLTAEKFIKNPYDDNEIYTRMYRTGDLVRFLADGNLEFLGRIDQQVKIRGFRIEIGEIEQKIMEYTKVKETVVVVKEDATGNKFLCAYFTAGEKVDIESLKEYMGNGLPNYMIPSDIMQIDVMPINANGKIDKKALPEISCRAKVEFVEPSTEAEKKVAKIWQTVLGIEKVSAIDNFFAIGGNSIKAISVVAKLQKFFIVSINDLFNYPVLRVFAENIKPSEDTLKVRLAEIKQRENELDKPLTDEPQFKEIYDKSMREYKDKNVLLHTLDFTERKIYKNVLVTGATGYLGAHIAQYLLKERSCKVFVLVRSKDANSAKERLCSKFDYYFGSEFWQKFNLDERLVVLCSDLHKKQMGLLNDVYDKLCAEVDAIIHSAANVSHYGHYDDFYASNVQATIELLTFAKTGCKKDFHHISTMSVAEGEIPDCKYHVFSEYQTDLGQKSGNHYVETKLESEKVVIAARQEGLNTSIYRAGNIAFQKNTGLYQENIDSNAFYQRLQGYINIGMVPNKLDTDEYAYVDCLAEAIVRLSECAAAQNQTYHMQNPQLVKLSQVLTEPALDLNIKSVSVGEFFDYLYENIEKSGFKEHIEKILTHMGLMDEEKKTKTVMSVVMDKTLFVLEKVGFVWPTFEAVNLRPMVVHALNERMEILRKNKILAVLDEESLLKLARRAQLKIWRRRSEIVWEGEKSEQVYLIVKGFAQILRSSIGGWQGMLGISKKNEFIALELASIADKSKFSVEATMGDTLVLALPCDILRELGRDNSKMLLEMLSVVWERVDKLSRLVVSLG